MCVLGTHHDGHCQQIEWVQLQFDKINRTNITNEEIESDWIKENQDQFIPNKSLTEDINEQTDQIQSVQIELNQFGSVIPVFIAIPVCWFILFFFLLSVMA